MNKIRDSIDRQLQNQPREVIFCKKCVVSNQRPRITFDEDGICSACRFGYEKQHRIDWARREDELRMLCDQYRCTDGRYDVIVPCSGGKDSATVAHKLKHVFGMHPLTVTWAPFMYTDIGRVNYDNFVSSGFTNIKGSPNGHLHRKLTRIAFEAVGDAFLPFIYGQMCFAFHVALQQDIRLVFFGENGEAEYGGVSKYNYCAHMPLEDWAEVYFKGVTVHDLIQWGQHRGLLTEGELHPSDLTFYQPPEISTLQGKGIQMHWFSYYQKWVPQENYYYAAEHLGFQANQEGRSEGTYSKYASLDDKLDGWHYYLGFIKFGIGRCTSDAAHEVRDGHLRREEAVTLVRRFDGEFPNRHFHECLEYVGISEQEFHRVVDRYRSPHLWERANGEWKLRNQVS